MIAGFGMGLAYSAHAQLALRSVAEAEVGSTTAALQLTDNLGIALGTGVVGAIVTFGDESGWLVGDAVAVALIVPACVAAIGLWLSRRLPRTSDLVRCVPAPWRSDRPRRRWARDVRFDDITLRRVTTAATGRAQDGSDARGGTHMSKQPRRATGWRPGTTREDDTSKKTKQAEDQAQEDRARRAKRAKDPTADERGQATERERTGVRSQAEAEGLRGRARQAAGRVGGDAGVGQVVGGEGLHRVRGSRHRRQGWGDQADRGTGQPAHLPCGRACRLRPNARSRRCTSSGTSRTSRPPARW